MTSIIYNYKSIFGMVLNLAALCQISPPAEMAAENNANSKPFTSYKMLAHRILDATFIAMDKRLSAEADIVIAPKLSDTSMFADDIETLTRSIAAVKKPRARQCSNKESACSHRSGLA